MSVFDENSGRSFLVDSGADISVFPLSFLPSSTGAPPVSRPGQRLHAANGSFIETFGTKTLHLQLQGFKVRHSFRVAKVAQPILGADFFRKHSVLIDVKGACLRLTGGAIIEASALRPVQSQVSRVIDYANILTQYPDITQPKFDPDHQPAHGVRHVVPTTGPPVFARASFIGFFFRPSAADNISITLSAVQ